jgi:hypothetical protein
MSASKSPKKKRVKFYAQISSSSFIYSNTGLSAIIAAPTFFLSIDEYQVAIYLKLAAILFSATFTFFVLFLSKLIFIGKYMTTQRWFRFWHIYPQHRHHHKQHDPNDLDRMGSCSELTSAYRFETQSDSNAHNALVAKNLLDFTVKAHEGILPVKKRARFHFMSIWQLKHVVVIPSKQTFMLMTVSERLDSSAIIILLIHTFFLCRQWATKLNTIIMSHVKVYRKTTVGASSFVYGPTRMSSSISKYTIKMH